MKKKSDFRIWCEERNFNTVEKAQNLLSQVPPTSVNNWWYGSRSPPSMWDAYKALWDKYEALRKESTADDETT